MNSSSDSSIANTKKHEKQYVSHQTKIQVGQMLVGGAEPVIMAGPCAVESYEQLTEVALALKALNIKGLRAGAFKPRTSPY